MKKRKKEIIILSQYFYPDIASTGLLLTDLCLGFVKKGFGVKVFTAKPTFDIKIIAPEKENYSGIHIFRLFSLRLDKNKSELFNILNSISYFISVILKILLSSETSKIMFVSNPPFLALGALFVNVFKKNPIVYLIHDYFPDAGIRLGLIKENSFISKMWDSINKIVIERCENIIVLSEQMKKNLERKFDNYKYDVRKKVMLSMKIKVIHNWANEKLITNIEKNENVFLKENSFVGKFIVMYSGNLSVFYKLEILINTARYIKNENIEFIIIGDGGQKKTLVKLKEKYSLKNVHFFPYLDLNLMKYSINAADVLVLFTKEKLNGLAVPSKLYTYMAFKKPIILISDSCSDSDLIIKEANCGYSVRFSEMDLLIEKINYLFGNKNELGKLATNAIVYYNNNFKFEIALSKYINILFSNEKL